MDCPHGDGSGIDPDDEDGTAACPECDGTGHVEDDPAPNDADQ